LHAACRDVAGKGVKKYNQRGLKIIFEKNTRITF